MLDPLWTVPRRRFLVGNVDAFHRRRGTVSPVPEFDAGHYLRLYPDVAAAWGVPAWEDVLERTRATRARSERTGVRSASVPHQGAGR